MLTKYYFVTYSVFFFSIILFSLLINSILLKFVKTLGIRDTEGTFIRWSSVSKPALGGLSFYMIFLISTACYSIFFDQDNIFHNKEALGLIGACSLAFLMGLADDAYNTKPFLKFFVQVACGVILIMAGSYIQIFESDYLNYALTIFWVVGVMNSINMLDNMDAITSLVSIFILLSMLFYLLLQDSMADFYFIIMLGVLGALIGFLFFNWHPSKMFMGDTGSQFLGIFLAACAIQLLWNSKGLDYSEVDSRQATVVILAFLLPLVDTTVVFVNRLRRKQSPFIGGKDHTTHHLSYLGLTDSQVAFIFIGLSFVNLVLAFAIFRFADEWNHFYTAGFITYFSLVLLSAFYLTMINKKNGKVS